MYLSFGKQIRAKSHIVTSVGSSVGKSGKPSRGKVVAARRPGQTGLQLLDHTLRVLGESPPAEEHGQPQARIAQVRQVPAGGGQDERINKLAALDVRLGADHQADVAVVQVGAHLVVVFDHQTVGVQNARPRKGPALASR
ncbi:hypothetical protein PG988_004716 [Apiospora saccharicola]